LTTDLIVISCLTNIEKGLKYNSRALDWLQYHYERGTEIASVCTGSFLLAETGLLNDKTATIHWGFANLFQQMYPNIVLKPERLITDEGDLYCSGAINSGIDLAVYLVEKYCGHEVAVQSSKAMIHDRVVTPSPPILYFSFKENIRTNRLKRLNNG